MKCIRLVIWALESEQKPENHILGFKEALRFQKLKAKSQTVSRKFKQWLRKCEKRQLRSFNSKQTISINKGVSWQVFKISFMKIFEGYKQSSERLKVWILTSKNSQISSSSKQSIISPTSFHKPLNADKTTIFN